MVSYLFYILPPFVVFWEAWPKLSLFFHQQGYLDITCRTSSQHSFDYQLTIEPDNPIARLSSIHFHTLADTLPLHHEGHHQNGSCRAKTREQNVGNNKHLIENYIKTVTDLVVMSSRSKRPIVTVTLLSMKTSSVRTRCFSASCCKRNVRRSKASALYAMKISTLAIMISHSAGLNVDRTFTNIAWKSGES